MHNLEQSQTVSSPVFEIKCGKTASPMRPIIRDRFLIGSGPRCDLRLGGEGMPDLHSIVHIEGGAISIDPVADIPELLVNGHSGMAELQDGDEIRIGQFRMVLHGAPSQAESSPEPELVEDEPIDPAELSASELVALIEQEEALIEEFEEGRRAGASALLDAVEHRATSLVSKADAAGEADPGELLGGIRSAVVSLGQSARQLEEPASLTEDDVREAAASLLDCQQQIISALDRVLDKIERQNAWQESRRDVA